MCRVAAALVALVAATALGRGHDVHPLDVDPRMPQNDKPIDAPTVLDAKDDIDVTPPQAKPKNMMVKMDADEKEHMQGGHGGDAAGVYNSCTPASCAAKSHAVCSRASLNELQARLLPRL